MAEVSKQFVRFGVVGAVGFCIDAGVLYALIHRGVNPYAGRLLSFPLAVSATWYLNRKFTFTSMRAGLPISREYARYFAIQIAGALANYACYAAVLRIVGTTAATAIVALAVGAVLGLLVNFLGVRYLAFTSDVRGLPGGNYGK